MDRFDVALSGTVQKGVQEEHKPVRRCAQVQKKPQPEPEPGRVAVLLPPRNSTPLCPLPRREENPGTPPHHTRRRSPTFSPDTGSSRSPVLVLCGCGLILFSHGRPQFHQQRHFPEMSKTGPPASSGSLLQDPQYKLQHAGSYR